MTVKTGDLMAFLYYGIVESVSRDGKRIEVRDVDNSTSFQIEGEDLIKAAKSANSFEEEKHVSKTELAEVFVHCKNVPFSVCFTKSKGGDRVLLGRLVSSENLLGRSMVEDLELTSGNRLRQVDHRTIKWLIVNNVKYVVK